MQDLHQMQRNYNHQSIKRNTLDDLKVVLFLVIIN